jgi:hypothetical protein
MNAFSSGVSALRFTGTSLIAVTEFITLDVARNKGSGPLGERACATMIRSDQSHCRVFCACSHFMTTHPVGYALNAISRESHPVKALIAFMAYPLLHSNPAF